MLSEDLNLLNQLVRWKLPLCGAPILYVQLFQKYEHIAIMCPRFFSEIRLYE